jgi:DNA-binding NarL/FixJ family response regulator
MIIDFAPFMSLKRVLIADDHAVIRTGLRYLLNSRFPDATIAEVDSGAALLKALDSTLCNFLILDLQLGDFHGLDILPEILSKYPGVNILIYSMSPEVIYGKRLLQYGAAVKGFLSKQAEEETVIRALGLFLSGQKYLSDELRMSLRSETAGISSPFDALSEREMTVLRFLLQGIRVKEISNRMNLKMSTVATYKVRLFEKLNVDNVADMQRLADVYRLTE